VCVCVFISIHHHHHHHPARSSPSQVDIVLILLRSIVLFLNSCFFFFFFYYFLIPKRKVMSVCVCVCYLVFLLQWRKRVVAIDQQDVRVIAATTITERLLLLLAQLALLFGLLLVDCLLCSLVR